MFKKLLTRSYLWATVTEGAISGTTLIDQGVLQSFSFGPILVQNSKAVSISTKVASSANPRTAIGQISPLHYIIVVVDGRSSTSNGMTLSQLTQAFVQKGCTIAYNLDGGGSSTTWFNGSIIRLTVKLQVNVKSAISSISEVNMKKLNKTILVYVGLTIFTFLFNQIYALFAHGVSSENMSNMYLVLLVLGVGMYVLLKSTLPKSIFNPYYRLFTNIYNAGIAALVVGVCLSGVLEIAGGTSVYVSWFGLIGECLIVLGLVILTVIAFQKNKEVICNPESN